MAEFATTRDNGRDVFPAACDRICLTAACAAIPPPLIEQLAPGGRIIGPLIEEGVQNLVLLVKRETDMVRTVVCQVLYVPMQGVFAPDEGLR